MHPDPNHQLMAPTSRRQVLVGSGSAALGIGALALPRAAAAASLAGVGGGGATSTVPGGEVEVFRRVDALTLSSSTVGGFDGDAVLDADGRHAYFPAMGTTSRPAAIAKIDLQTMTEVGVLPLAVDENVAYPMVRVANHLYIGARRNPDNSGATSERVGRLVKVRLDAPAGDGVVSGMQRLGRLSFNEAADVSGAVEMRPLQIVVTADGSAVVALGNEGTSLIRVDLKASTDDLPTRLGSIQLAASEFSGGGLATDGTDLFLVTEFNRWVVRIALTGGGEGTGGLLRTGAIQLPAEDANYLYSILAVSGHLYIGTWLNSAPARIVKVRTSGGGAGTGGLERIGATTLLTDERSIGWAVVTGSSFAYYGTTTQPGRVVKVHLNAGTDVLPERVDGLTLVSGEDWLGSAVRIGQYLYFGTGTYPGRIVRCVDPAL